MTTARLQRSSAASALALVLALCAAMPSLVSADCVFNGADTPAEWPVAANWAGCNGAGGLPTVTGTVVTEPIVVVALLYIPTTYTRVEDVTLNGPNGQLQLNADQNIELGTMLVQTPGEAGCSGQGGVTTITGLVTVKSGGLQFGGTGSVVFGPSSSLQLSDSTTGASVQVTIGVDGSVTLPPVTIASFDPAPVCTLAVRSTQTDIDASRFTFPANLKINTYTPSSVVMSLIGNGPYTIHSLEMTGTKLVADDDLTIGALTLDAIFEDAAAASLQTTSGSITLSPTAMFLNTQPPCVIQSAGDIVFLTAATFSGSLRLVAAGAVTANSGLTTGSTDSVLEVQAGANSNIGNANMGPLGTFRVQMSNGASLAVAGVVGDGGSNQVVEVDVQSGTLSAGKVICGTLTLGAVDAATLSSSDLVSVLTSVQLGDQLTTIQATTTYSLPTVTYLNPSTPGGTLSLQSGSGTSYIDVFDVTETDLRMTAPTTSTLIFQSSNPVVVKSLLISGGTLSLTGGAAATFTSNGACTFQTAGSLTTNSAAAITCGGVVVNADTTVSGGQLTLGAITGSGNRQLTLTSGATGSSFTSVTGVRELALAGSASVSGGVTLSGTLTLTGGTLSISGANNNFESAHIVIDSTSAASGVTVAAGTLTVTTSGVTSTGSNAVTLSATDVTINGANLDLQSTGVNAVTATTGAISMPGGAVSAASGSSNTFTAGGMASFGTGITAAGPVTVHASAFALAAVSVANTLTLTATATNAASSATSIANGLTALSVTTGSAHVLTITSGDVTVGGPIVIAGTVETSGAVTTSAGDITVSGGSLTATGAIASADKCTFDTGAGTLKTVTAGDIVCPNGVTATHNATLQSAGALSITANGIAASASNPQVELKLTSTSTINGGISGGTRLLLTGTGQLTVPAALSVASFEQRAGTLVITGDSTSTFTSTGSCVFAGSAPATLQLPAGADLTCDGVVVNTEVTLAAAQLTLGAVSGDGSSPLTLTASASGSTASGIAGVTGLALTGSLAVSGAVTVSATTVVTDGTLSVSGSAFNFQTAALVLHATTAAAGVTVAAGTLTATNGVSSSGTFDVTLSGTAIAISGAAVALASTGANVVTATASGLTLSGGAGVTAADGSSNTFSAPSGAVDLGAGITAAAPVVVSGQTFTLGAVSITNTLTLTGSAATGASSAASIGSGLTGLTVTLGDAVNHVFTVTSGAVAVGGPIHVTTGWLQASSAVSTTSGDIELSGGQITVTGAAIAAAARCVFNTAAGVLSTTGSGDITCSNGATVTGGGASFSVGGTLFMNAAIAVSGTGNSIGVTVGADSTITGGITGATANLLIGGTATVTVPAALSVSAYVQNGGTLSLTGGSTSTFSATGTCLFQTAASMELKTAGADITCGNVVSATNAIISGAKLTFAIVSGAGELSLTASAAGSTITSVASLIRMSVTGSVAVSGDVALTGVGHLTITDGVVTCGALNVNFLSVAATNGAAGVTASGAISATTRIELTGAQATSVEGLSLATGQLVMSAATGANTLSTTDGPLAATGGVTLGTGSNSFTAVGTTNNNDVNFGTAGITGTGAVSVAGRALTLGTVSVTGTVALTFTSASTAASIDGSITTLTVTGSSATSLVSTGAVRVSTLTIKGGILSTSGTTAHIIANGGCTFDTAAGTLRTTDATANVMCGGVTATAADASLQAGGQLNLGAIAGASSHTLTLSAGADSSVSIGGNPKLVVGGSATISSSDNIAVSSYTQTAGTLALTSTATFASTGLCTFGPATLHTQGGTIVCQSTLVTDATTLSIAGSASGTISLGDATHDTELRAALTCNGAQLTGVTVGALKNTQSGSPSLSSTAPVTGTAGVSNAVALTLTGASTFDLSVAAGAVSVTDGVLTVANGNFNAGAVTLTGTNSVTSVKVPSGAYVSNGLTTSGANAVDVTVLSTVSTGALSVGTTSGVATAIAGSILTIGAVTGTGDLSLTGRSIVSIASTVASFGTTLHDVTLEMGYTLSVTSGAVTFNALTARAGTLSFPAATVVTTLCTFTAGSTKIVSTANNNIACGSVTVNAGATADFQPGSGAKVSVSGATDVSGTLSSTRLYDGAGLTVRTGGSVSVFALNAAAVSVTTASITVTDGAFTASDDVTITAAAASPSTSITVSAGALSFQKALSTSGANPVTITAAGTGLSVTGATALASTGANSLHATAGALTLTGGVSSAAGSANSFVADAGAVSFGAVGITATAPVTVSGTTLTLAAVSTSSSLSLTASSAAVDSTATSIGGSATSLSVTLAAAARKLTVTNGVALSATLSVTTGTLEAGAAVAVGGTITVSGGSVVTTGTNVDISTGVGAACVFDTAAGALRASGTLFCADGVTATTADATLAATSVMVVGTGLASASTRTITIIASDNAALGPVSGTPNLVLTGAGNVVAMAPLTVATYTASAGTLTLNGAGALISNGLCTFQTGASRVVTDSTNGGNVQCDSMSVLTGATATIVPNSGALTVTNALTAASTLTVSTGTFAAGSVTVTGSTVTVTAGATCAVTNALTLTTTTGADASFVCTAGAVSAGTFTTSGSSAHNALLTAASIAGGSATAITFGVPSVLTASSGTGTGLVLAAATVNAAVTLDSVTLVTAGALTGSSGGAQVTVKGTTDSTLESVAFTGAGNKLRVEMHDNTKTLTVNGAVSVATTAGTNGLELVAGNLVTGTSSSALSITTTGVCAFSNGATQATLQAVGTDSVVSCGGVTVTSTSLARVKSSSTIALGAVSGASGGSLAIEAVTTATAASFANSLNVAFTGVSLHLATGSVQVGTLTLHGSALNVDAGSVTAQSCVFDTATALMTASGAVDCSSAGVTVGGFPAAIIAGATSTLGAVTNGAGDFSATTTGATSALTLTSVTAGAGTVSLTAGAALTISSAVSGASSTDANPFRLTAGGPISIPTISNLNARAVSVTGTGAQRTMTVATGNVVVGSLALNSVTVVAGTGSVTVAGACSVTASSGLTAVTGMQTVACGSLDLSAAAASLTVATDNGFAVTTTTASTVASTSALMALSGPVSFAGAVTSAGTISTATGDVAFNGGVTLSGALTSTSTSTPIQFTFGAASTIPAALTLTAGSALVTLSGALTLQDTATLSVAGAAVNADTVLAQQTPRTAGTIRVLAGATLIATSLDNAYVDTDTTGTSTLQLTAGFTVADLHVRGGATLAVSGSGLRLTAATATIEASGVLSVGTTELTLTGALTAANAGAVLRTSRGAVTLATGSLQKLEVITAVGSTTIAAGSVAITDLTVTMSGTSTSVTLSGTAATVAGGAVALSKSGSQYLSVGSGVSLGGTVSGSGNLLLSGCTFGPAAFSSYTGAVSGPLSGSTTTLNAPTAPLTLPSFNAWAGAVLLAGTTGNVVFTSATVSDAATASLGVVASNTPALSGTINLGAGATLTLTSNGLSVPASSTLRVVRATSSATLALATYTLSVAGTVEIGSASGVVTVTAGTGGAFTGAGTLSLLSASLPDAAFAGFTGTLNGPASLQTTTVALTAADRTLPFSPYAGALGLTGDFSATLQVAGSTTQLGAVNVAGTGTTVTLTQAAAGGDFAGVFTFASGGVLAIDGPTLSGSIDCGSVGAVTLRLVSGAYTGSSMLSNACPLTLATTGSSALAGSVVGLGAAQVTVNSGADAGVTTSLSFSVDSAQLALASAGNGQFTGPITTTGAAAHLTVNAATGATVSTGTITLGVSTSVLTFSGPGAVSAPITLTADGVTVAVTNTAAVFTSAIQADAHPLTLAPSAGVTMGGSVSSSSAAVPALTIVGTDVLTCIVNAALSFSDASGTTEVNIDTASYARGEVVNSQLGDAIITVNLLHGAYFGGVWSLTPFGDLKEGANAENGEFAYTKDVSFQTETAGPGPWDQTTTWVGTPGRVPQESGDVTIHAHVIATPDTPNAYFARSVVFDAAGGSIAFTGTSTLTVMNTLRVTATSGTVTVTGAVTIRGAVTVNAGATLRLDASTVFTASGGATFTGALAGVDATTSVFVMGGAARTFAFGASPANVLVRVPSTATTPTLNVVPAAAITIAALEVAAGVTLQVTKAVSGGALTLSGSSFAGDSSVLTTAAVPITFAQSGTHTLRGTVASTGAANTIRFAAGAVDNGLTVDGSTSAGLTVSLAVTLAGSAPLSITGANTVAGISSETRTIAVGSGSTVAYGAGVTVNGDQRVSGTAGTLSLGAGTTVTLGAANTLPTSVTGPATGTATLALGTFSTTINALSLTGAGAVKVTGATSAVLTTTGAVTLPTGTTLSTAGPQLAMANSASGSTLAGAVAVTSDVTSGNAAVTIGGGAGTVQLNAGFSYTNAGSSSTATTLSVTATSGAAVAVTITSATALTLSGSWMTASGNSVLLAGAGVISVAANAIFGAGTINVDDDSIVTAPNAAVVLPATACVNTPVIAVGTASATLPSVTWTAGVACGLSVTGSGAGALSVSGAFAMSGGSAASVSTQVPLTLVAPVLVGTVTGAVRVTNTLTASNGLTLGSATTKLEIAGGGVLAGTFTGAATAGALLSFQSGSSATDISGFVNAASTPVSTEVAQTSVLNLAAATGAVTLPSLRVLPGATVVLQRDVAATAAALTVSGAVTMDDATSTILTENVPFTASSATNVLRGAVTIGSGAPTVTLSGTVSGAFTYTNSLGSNAGSSLVLSSVTAQQSVTITGTQPISVSGSVSMTDSTARTFLLSGTAVTSSVAFTSSNAAHVLQLGAANILNLNSATALDIAVSGPASGVATINVVADATTSAKALTMQTGATATVVVAGATTATTVFAVAGAVTLAAAGTLRTSGPALKFDAAVAHTFAGTIELTGSALAHLTLGSSSTPATVLAASTLRLVHNGAASSAAFDLFAGFGSDALLDVSGANAIAFGGALTGLGSTSTATLGGTVTSTASFATSTAGSLQLSDGTTLNPTADNLAVNIVAPAMGTATLAVPTGVTLATVQTLSFAAGSAGTLRVTGTSAESLAPVGASTIRAGAVLSTAGPTITLVSGTSVTGTIEASASAAVSLAGSAVTGALIRAVNSGTTLTLTGAVTVASSNALQLRADVVGATVVLGTSASTGTLTVSGAGALSLIGAGAFAFAADAAKCVLSTTNGVSLATDATGTVSGAVTVGTTGSVATLTVTNAVSVAAGATLTVVSGVATSQLALSAAVTVPSDATVVLGSAALELPVTNTAANLLTGAGTLALARCSISSDAIAVTTVTGPSVSNVQTTVSLAADKALSLDAYLGTLAVTGAHTLTLTLGAPNTGALVVTSSTVAVTGAFSFAGAVSLAGTDATLSALGGATVTGTVTATTTGVATLSTAAGASFTGTVQAGTSALVLNAGAGSTLDGQVFTARTTAPGVTVRGAVTSDFFIASAFTFTVDDAGTYMGYITMTTGGALTFTVTGTGAVLAGTTVSTTPSGAITPALGVNPAIVYTVSRPTAAKVNGPWDDDNTWTNFKPTDQTDVTIGSGFVVTVSASGAVARGVILSGGGRLTVNPTYSLALGAGGLTVSSSQTATVSGTVTIGAGQGLVVSDSATLTLDAATVTVSASVSVVGSLVGANTALLVLKSGTTTLSSTASWSAGLALQVSDGTGSSAQAVTITVQSTTVVIPSLTLADHAALTVTAGGVLKATAVSLASGAAASLAGSVSVPNTAGSAFTLAGALTLGAGADLAVATNSADHTISGSVTGGAGSALTLGASGATGAVLLSGAQFTGVAVNIAGASVRAATNSPVVLGAATTLAVTAASTVVAGADFAVAAASGVTNAVVALTAGALTIPASSTVLLGDGAAGANALTVTVTSGSFDGTGKLQLARVSLPSSAIGANVLLVGPAATSSATITVSADGAALTFTTPASAGQITLTGAHTATLSGTPVGGETVLAGGAVVTFAGAGEYGAAVTVTNGGVVINGAPATTLSGAMTFGAAATVTLTNGAFTGTLTTGAFAVTIAVQSTTVAFAGSIVQSVGGRVLLTGDSADATVSATVSLAGGASPAPLSLSANSKLTGAVTFNGDATVALAAGAQVTPGINAGTRVVTLSAAGPFAGTLTTGTTGSLVLVGTTAASEFSGAVTLSSTAGGLTLQENAKVSGAITLTSAATVTVTAASASITTAIVNGANTLTLSPSVAFAVSVTAASTGGVVVTGSAATTLTLQSSGGAKTVTLTGTTAGVALAGTITHATGSGVLTLQNTASGAAVAAVFNAAVNAQTDVTLSGSAAIASAITFGGSSATYQLSLDGTSTATYTGAVTTGVNTVTIASTSGRAFGGTVTVAAGATLTCSGTGAFGTGAIAVSTATSTSTTVAVGDSVTLSNAVSFTGPAGTALLKLGAAAVYNGVLTLSGGVTTLTVEPIASGSRGSLGANARINTAVTTSVSLTSVDVNAAAQFGGTAPGVLLTLADSVLPSPTTSTEMFAAPLRTGADGVQLTVAAGASTASTIGLFDLKSVAVADTAILNLDASTVAAGAQSAWAALQIGATATLRVLPAVTTGTASLFVQSTLTLKPSASGAITINRIVVNVAAAATASVEVANSAGPRIELRGESKLVCPSGLNVVYPGAVGARDGSASVLVVSDADGAGSEVVFAGAFGWMMPGVATGQTGVVTVQACVYTPHGAVNNGTVTIARPAICNQCSSSPCQNAGVCTDRVGSYECACLAGYSDAQCATNIDECSSTPCQNGATCVDGVASYSCTCAAGFSGVLCQTDIDECASNPCLVRDGVVYECHDAVNSFTCDCPAGYTGSVCQTNINECASNPCRNGATCVDGENSFTCQCTTGYYGALCQSFGAGGSSSTGLAGPTDGVVRFTLFFAYPLSDVTEVNTFLTNLVTDLSTRYNFVASRARPVTVDAMDVTTSSGVRIRVSLLRDTGAFGPKATTPGFRVVMDMYPLVGGESSSVIVARITQGVATAGSLANTPLAATPVQRTCLDGTVSTSSCPEDNPDDGDSGSDSLPLWAGILIGAAAVLVLVLIVFLIGYYVCGCAVGGKSDAHRYADHAPAAPKKALFDEHAPIEMGTIGGETDPNALQLNVDNDVASLHASTAPTIEELRARAMAGAAAGATPLDTMTLDTSAGPTDATTGSAGAGASAGADVVSDDAVAFVVPSDHAPTGKAAHWRYL